jgi:hypothetical protein
MSNSVIDSIFFHGNYEALEKKLEKNSDTVDKFIIFSKEEIDLEFFSGVTKPVDLVISEKELLIDEFIEYFKNAEHNFEDVITLSNASEFYDIQKIEDVKKLLPFGPVLSQKKVFKHGTDLVEYFERKGTLFVFYNHIKFDHYDVKEIWLNKNKEIFKNVSEIEGGFQF